MTTMMTMMKMILLCEMLLNLSCNQTRIICFIIIPIPFDFRESGKFCLDGQKIRGKNIGVSDSSWELRKKRLNLGGPMRPSIIIWATCIPTGWSSLAKHWDNALNANFPQPIPNQNNFLITGFCKLIDYKISSLNFFNYTSIRFCPVYNWKKMVNLNRKLAELTKVRETSNAIKRSWAACKENRTSSSFHHPWNNLDNFSTNWKLFLHKVLNPIFVWFFW